MRSPTAALLWSIWRRHTTSAWAIAAMTGAAWLLHLSEVRGRVPGAPPDPSPLVVMMGMLSFLLLIGVCGYTDSTADTDIARFPRRPFTLPVSTLRLVAVPVAAGIVAVELFYVAWREPLSRGEPGSPLFTAVLLAVFIVLLQTVLWTLDRAGALRIVIAGALGILFLALNLLPWLPPSPPPLWRTEAVLAALVTLAGAAAFAVSLAHVQRLRTGGGASGKWTDALRDRLADAMPGRRGIFASPAAAHFWFEWRTGGAVLPALVVGAIVVALGPLSWSARGDATDTMRLLIFALATPVVLALPVGMAASKPRFWSEDLSVPAFVAVRPLSAADIVATKVKVAAASAAAAWLVLLLFVATWLSLWGNLERLRLIGSSLITPDGGSTLLAAIPALTIASAMFLTWRFLVCRLASGLSGNRRWFFASVLTIPLVVVTALLLDAGRFFDWLGEDPSRLTLAAWVAAAAVLAKAAFATFAWRSVPAHYVRAYGVAWLLGAVVFMTLGAAIWRIALADAPLAPDRALVIIVLLSLLLLPLGRIGFAVSRLARNRHR